MDTIEDISGARRALRRYLTGAEATLPAETFERLETLADSPSPVDAIVRSAELLYARHDELDDAGRTLVAQLAGFGAVNAWHGLADGNRGGRIAQAMLRAIAGEGAAEGEPEPKAEYVPAAEPAPAPAT